MTSQANVKGFLLLQQVAACCLLPSNSSYDACDIRALNNEKNSREGQSGRQQNNKVRLRGLFGHAPCWQRCQSGILGMLKEAVVLLQVLVRDNGKRRDINHKQ